MNQSIWALERRTLAIRKMTSCAGPEDPSFYFCFSNTVIPDVWVCLEIYHVSSTKGSTSLEGELNGYRHDLGNTCRMWRKGGKAQGVKKDISGIQSSLLPIATQWSTEMSVQILERSLPHLGSNIWTLTECCTHKPNGEIQCMTDKIPVSSWKLYSNKEVKDKRRIYTYIYR